MNRGPCRENRFLVFHVSTSETASFGSRVSAVVESLQDLLEKLSEIFGQDGDEAEQHAWG